MFVYFNQRTELQSIFNFIHVLVWWLLLTRHPVVVQLSLIILLLWAEGLQSQLQLLSVQWVFDAQLLNSNKEASEDTPNIPEALHSKG